MPAQTARALFHDFERWGFDSKGWSPRTRKKYRERIEVAERWLREQGTSIRWASARDLKAYLFSTTPTARNRNNIRQALVGFGEFLVDTEVRAENPALGLPRLEEPEAFQRALTVEEAREVRLATSALAPMDRAIALLFLFGGLRMSELRFLERSHYDGEWLQFRGKRSRVRAVKVHPKAKVALDGWLILSREAKWVFPSPQRSSTRPVSETYVQNMLLDLGRSAGIERLHAHLLRRTVATRMDEQGASLREIQDFLGHVDPKTTVSYTRIRPRRVGEAIDRLDFQSSSCSQPAEGASPRRRLTFSPSRTSSSARQGRGRTTAE